LKDYPFTAFLDSSGLAFVVGHSRYFGSHEIEIDFFDSQVLFFSQTACTILILFGLLLIFWSTRNIQA